MAITEYWKNRLNNLDFLRIQNVRQYHFHDGDKYEKKITEGKYRYLIRSLSQNEESLPVITLNISMVTSLIQ